MVAPTPGTTLVTSTSPISTPLLAANLPIAAVRAFIEISVASVGWYLGGTLGVGTLMFAFGIGPCIALSLFLIDKIMN